MVFMKRKIIGGGAEAIIYKEGSRAVKHRLKKGYRHPAIDMEFREGRTRREARVLSKAACLGLKVPRVLGEKAREGVLEIEFVRGKKMRDLLEREGASRKALYYCRKIGEGIALLHAHDIVHGDLTTSNFIARGDDVFFIDFGLSFHSARLEDKAVDLHLLRQAFESKHWRHWKKFFAAALEGYKKVLSKQAEIVLNRLKVVESRGRYKGKGEGS